MRYALFIAACVAFHSGNDAQAQKEPLTLAPSSEWKLRAFDDKCRASRVFGTGDNRTTLWIEQGGVEEAYNITLIGQPLRHPYGRAIALKFGEEEPSLRNYIIAKSSKGRPVISMFGATLVPASIEYDKDAATPRLDWERKSAIDTLLVSRSLRRAILFQLGPLGDPLRFLQACAEGLNIVLSKASQATGGQCAPAELTNKGRLKQLIEYPAYLVRTGMDGKLNFRLTVNASGKPTGCFITQSNRPQLFDDALCLGLLRHAQFTPAKDVSGNAVPSYYWGETTFKTR